MQMNELFFCKQTVDTAMIEDICTLTWCMPLHARPFQLSSSAVMVVSLVHLLAQQLKAATNMSADFCGDHLVYQLLYLLISWILACSWNFRSRMY